MADKVIYRASELGGCTKYLILKRLGYEPMDPPEGWTYFAAGVKTEAEVIALLEADGVKVYNQQMEVNLDVEGDIIVQGHLDGIVEEAEGGTLRVGEIKSMSDREFQKFAATRWETPGLVQRYKWQLSSYMVATRLEAVVFIYNRDTGELRREGIELPWYGSDEIKERVLGIESQVQAGEIPANCDIINYPCPFFYMHEKEEVEVEVDEEMDRLTAQYEDLRQQAKLAKDSVAATGKAIRGLLGNRTSVVTSRAAVSVSRVSTRRFSEHKAREAGVDVDRFMESKESTRLNVTIVGAADDGSGTGEVEES